MFVFGLCAYPVYDLWDYDDTLLLVSLITLCGIVLWKVCVIHRAQSRRDVTILGLDVSSTTYSPLPEPQVSKWPVLLYLFAAAVTFKLGVTVFETYQYLRDLLAAWFG